MSGFPANSRARWDGTPFFVKTQPFLPRWCAMELGQWAGRRLGGGVSVTAASSVAPGLVESGRPWWPG